LQVDISILNTGGNLISAMFMAVRAALYNTRIPQLIVDPAVSAADSTSPVEFEVLADEQEMMRLNVERVPLCVSLAVLADRYVVDATAEEEACASVRVHCAVDAAGQMVLMHKDGAGSVAPTLLVGMVQIAKRLAMGMIQQQDAVLREDEGRQEEEKVGFFA
jgi:exosome complex component RRP42